jgi:CDP-diacylglycerol--serine O-phosphatidyltransferase
MALGSPSYSLPPVRKKGRLRRGIYLLPSLFTVGTLICGFYAILQSLRGAGLLAMQADAHLAFDYAARAIGWAIVFDGLDGRIARMTNASSEFGREFDSLADVITFGLAPALLAFSWGVRPVAGVQGLPVVHHLPQIGLVVTFGFLICGAARLARFNIDSVKPTTDRRAFVGLPIPGAAGVIAATVHFFKDPISEWPFVLVFLALVASLAFLMVSRVRYPSFKAFDLRRRRSFLTIILIGLIVLGVWAFSEQVLLILALVYASSGPVSRLVSKIRPQPPAPKEVHAS